MKLNLETIKEEIAAFTAYFSQLCFTLLTWQVVLTGSIAYVGLPSYFFDEIKVSYFMVGHTHEDIDQRWSTIGNVFAKKRRSYFPFELLFKQ